MRQWHKSPIPVNLNINQVRKQEADELEATKFDLHWYAPHDPVFNLNKPEKIRPVCNATSIYKSIALNDKPMCGPDKLMSGPDQLQNLMGIILEFRVQKNCNDSLYRSYVSAN